MTKDELYCAVRRTAFQLMQERGLSEPDACRIAARSVLRAAGLPLPAGLGADPAPGTPAILSQVAAVGNDPMVTALRNAVSPWLWVSSLIGFAMGIMNTRRIGQMYSKWKQRNRGR